LVEGTEIMEVKERRRKKGRKKSGTKEKGSSVEERKDKITELAKKSILEYLRTFPHPNKLT
jgi:hypothetical protein